MKSDKMRALVILIAFIPVVIAASYIGGCTAKVAREILDPDIKQVRVYDLNTHSADPGDFINDAVGLPSGMPE